MKVSSPLLGQFFLVLLTLAYFLTGRVRAEDGAGGIGSVMMESQLEIAQTRWNALFGNSVVSLEGYEFHGFVDSSIVDEMKDLSNSWYMADDGEGGDVLVHLSDLNLNATVQEIFADSIDDSVQLGQIVYKVNWFDLVNETFFSTLAVGDDDVGITYDVLMSSLIIDNPDGEVSSSNRALAAGGKCSVYWLWGSERGRVSWEVECVAGALQSGNIICQKNECKGWMNIGAYDIQCSVNQVENCCIMDVGFGLRTPIGDIKIKFNVEKGEFEVSITGIGSSKGGSEQEVDCCPPIPIPAPIPAPTYGPTTYEPTTYAPTKSPEDPGVVEDPHIIKWTGKVFDLFALCDLILFSNPDFRNGLGLDVQMRVVSREYDGSNVFNRVYAQQLLVRIGEAVYEVGGVRGAINHWMNGDDLGSIHRDDPIPPEIFMIAHHDDGIYFPVTFHDIDDQHYEMHIHLSGDSNISDGGLLRIEITSYFINIHFTDVSSEDKGSGLGLMGRVEDGASIARDGVTVIEDSFQAALEWQVREDDPMLFHELGSGVHAPDKCIFPSGELPDGAFDEGTNN